MYASGTQRTSCSHEIVRSASFEVTPVAPRMRMYANVGRIHGAIA
jgi:hypothetical protein